MQLHKKIFLSILILQLCIIVYLLYVLYSSYTSAISISPIKKNTLTLSPTDQLRYFFEPRPNMEIKEPYYKQVSLSSAPLYTINNDTLNERYNYDIKKDKNTFRVITLGDSFTYGLYVDTKDNWPEKLEDTLHKNCKNTMKYEVINLGVSNYDLQYSVERLKRRGVKYDPDLVIWFVKYDDFAQINEITLPLRREYYKKMNIHEGSDKTKNSGEFWSYAKDIMQTFEKTYSQEEILTKQQEILSSISTFYTKNLLMILLDMEPKRHKVLLESFAKNRKNTYTYMDLPDFSRLPDRHPNSQGHQQIANNIFSYLQTNNFIRCR